MPMPLFSAFVLPLGSPFYHASLHSIPKKYQQAYLLILLCLLTIEGGGGLAIVFLHIEQVTEHVGEKLSQVGIASHDPRL